VSCILILSKSFIYQLMHNRVALKDGPGIESRLGGDFPHLSRPALRTTQPPVQWVWDVRSGRRVTLTPHPLLVSRSKIE